MNKTLIIFQKDWNELSKQRGLMLSTLVLPVMFTILPLAILASTTYLPSDQTNSGELVGIMRANPLLANLTPDEAAQATVGILFSTLFTMIPLILPSIIASYSVVGEKTNRTLEPLLAAPVKTWELLVGKSLASIAPSVCLTWLFALAFALALPLVTPSTRVVQAIISPGWVVLVLLCTPLMALIATAGMVIISSRVNDPRTAQQYSAIGVVPLMALIFGQLGGLLVVNVGFALLASVVLALLAILAIVVATRLFERETILTRWR